MVTDGHCSLSTGALSRLILSDDSLRQAVNEFRASKVDTFCYTILHFLSLINIMIIHSLGCGILRCL